MNDFVLVEWISDEERMLPNIGVFRKGERKRIPKDKADALIKQKCVKQVRPEPMVKEVKK